MSQLLYPIADSPGNIADVWETTPLWDKLDGPEHDSPSVSVKSGSTPLVFASSWVFSVQMAPAIEPSVHTGHGFRFRVKYTNIDCGAQIDSIYVGIWQGDPENGGSYITDSLIGAGEVVTDGLINVCGDSVDFFTYGYTLAEAEAAVITDYTDLWLQFIVTSPGGGVDPGGFPGALFEVSELSLSIPHEQGLIYSQDWSDGDGDHCVPSGGDVYYQSSAWAFGFDTPDSVYPECRISEDVKISVGTGPAGENVLRSDDGIVVDGAFAFADIGTLTSPSGETGYWDAQHGYVTLDFLLDAEVYNTTIFSPLVSVAESHSDDDRTFYVYLVTNAPATPTVLSLGIVYHTLDGGQQVVFTSQIYTDGVESGWQSLRLSWECGSINNDFYTVNPDGWVKVEVTPYGGAYVNVYEQTGIQLYINSGDDVADDSVDDSVIYSGLAVANWSKGVSLGYFGLTPTTNINVYDSLPSVVDGPNLTLTGDGGAIINGAPVIEILDGIVLNGTPFGIDGSLALAGEAKFLTNIPVNISISSAQWALYEFRFKARDEEIA